MMKTSVENEMIFAVDFNLINKYFKKDKDTLMKMSFAEILFLMEESKVMKEEDSIGFKLINKVHIWKKFYKHYQNFLDLGFSKEEIDLGLATLGRDSVFFEKIHLHKGKKPNAHYYEFISTGNASFPVPRTRSGKTETLPADFYNVSEQRFIGSFSGELFKFLIHKKLPFLSNYKLDVYNLDFYNEYSKDVYIKLSCGNSLYVPIMGLMTLDKDIVINRMISYFDKSTKGSYGKSEILLSDPTTIKFFKDMDNYKEKMNKN